MHYRGQLGIAETLAGNAAVGQAELARARDELLRLRAEGDSSERIGNSLLLVCASLGDKEAVEREAALMQQEMRAMRSSAPSWRRPSPRRSQLGQSDVRLAVLKQLLEKPGEDALTPALLRLDPRWDPLRSDARFQKLARR